jgi:VIT1/CCC1 family predicted Fe2+/Mn2+ transporter
MQEHAARHSRNDELDPFYLKSSKHLQRVAMEKAGLIPELVLPTGLLPIAREHDSPQLPGLSRTVAHRASESEQLWVRFGMASAGGLVLVVPMLVMANLETKIASLVTTCIAMFLFATGITVGTRLKPDQVLGATAAYAAVLVVFVGTSFST